MTRSRLSIGVFFVVAALLATAPLQAQYTTASLAGVIVDPSGATVPGAKVVVLNKDIGLSRTVQSSADGTYLFSALPVGVYDSSVEKTGFATYRQPGITLTVGVAASQTVTLAVGGTVQVATATAEAPMIETREATLSQLVGEKQVLDLPLNGRQAQSLVFLSAGTVDISTHYLTGQGGRYPGEIQAAVNAAAREP